MMTKISVKDVMNFRYPIKQYPWEILPGYDEKLIMDVLNLYKCSITLLTHTFKHLQTLLIVLELNGVVEEVPPF